MVFPFEARRQAAIQWAYCFSCTKSNKWVTWIQMIYQVFYTNWKESLASPCHTEAKFHSCHQPQGLATLCWISDRRCSHLVLPHNLCTGVEQQVKGGAFFTRLHTHRCSDRMILNLHGKRTTCTSKIHLMSRRAVWLLFTLVTGNGDVLERAPVLLIAFQGQLLGSGNHRTQTCTLTGCQEKMY